jgi:hypothetical protein
VAAGDIGELAADIEWARRVLSQRFATVAWAPGNHELWICGADPVQLQTGLYCAVVLLYDYSFLPPGATTAAEGLARALEAGVVCTDEILLHSDPYPSREAWCPARVEMTERRLAGLQPGNGTVLMSHFPLIREPRKLVLPRVRAVLRHDAHGRLARQVRRRRGGVRVSAYPTHNLARRSAV